MIGAGFSRRQLQQIRDRLLEDDLTGRDIININIHYRENPHPSPCQRLSIRQRGEIGELMPTVIASGLGVDMTTMTFDASQAIPMHCLAP